MDTPLYELLAEPELNDPVLIVGLEGFVDAGSGMAQTLDALRGIVAFELIARFDDDELIDYRSRRPTMRLDEGVNTGLTWPAIELRAGTDPGGRSVLLLEGSEPDRHWRSFAVAVVELAVRFGVELVVGVGAYPAPAPHTRPLRLASSATTAELAELVGHIDGQLDVPASVLAAVEREADRRGLRAVGIWAGVPHYAGALPYPPAAVALLDAVGQVADLGIAATDVVKQAAARHLARLDDMIRGNSQHLEMIAALEQHYDTIHEASTTDLPSGEELARKFQEMLRDDPDDQ